MNGGERVAEVLRRHGVQFLFTLVGGHISPILVSAKKAGIRVIDVRHEVNAVFAADAVARMTGVPGVAAVTAGPGVTNTITAIKNAQMAQVPLVLLGGATATILRGRGSLQDIDQMALIQPHVKWAARPDRLRDVVPALEKAFEIAQEGVPGPVFVEIAVDLLYDEKTVREWTAAKTDKPNKTALEKVQSAYIKAHLTSTFALSDGPKFIDPPQAAPRAPTGSALKKAASMLNGAKRPLMVLGSQAMLRPQRVAELVTAVERMGVPVYLSGMARGLLGADHPLQKRHQRRKALKEADVVLLAGVPADFRLDYGSHISRAKVIGLNLSEEDLTKNRRPELGLLADPHTTLVALAALVQRGGQLGEWVAALDKREAEREAEIDKMAEDRTRYCNPLEVCRAVEAHLAPRSVMIGDGGDFVATASYIVKPRGPLGWLDPGVFGTLGVGAGFALGAKLVRPDADVWLLWGDGAAGFSLIEMDTFARHGVPVIAVVGNDAGWTQIERDQVVILGDDVACRLTHMDYHVVAEACGGEGVLVSDPSALPEAFARALERSRAGKPVLINALIGKSDFRKGSISM
jgi:acetolactate synthase-1/2/3 large subunit